MKGYYLRSRETGHRISQMRAFDTAGNLTDLKVATPSLGFERTMSWRTTPSADDEPVPSYSADPYAYFLRFDPVAYRHALNERGVQPGRVLRFDEGHPYQKLSHRAIFTNSLERKVKVSSTTGRVSGTYENVPMWAIDTDTSLFKSKGIDIPEFPADDLAHFAQRAIAKTAPSTVAFDLARFIGELRERLPGIILSLVALRTRAEFFKALGNDYLNFQFGWAPFLGDLQDAFDAIIGASQVLQDLPLFGTPQRRHYRLVKPRETLIRANLNVGFSMKRTSTDEGDPSFGTLSSEVVKATLFKSKSVEYNFAGSYTRFLPVGFRPDSYLDRVATFTNVRLTPRVLWELAPWSWLIDWVLDIQSSIDSNQLANDESLFIHYAYASVRGQLQSRSEFHIKSKIPTIWGYTTYGGGSADPTLVTTSFKQRVRANPYGFTVGGLDALSGGQVAILAALGMSRLP